MERKLPKPGPLTLLAFLAPGVLIYLFIIVIPLLISLRFSLYRWSFSASTKFEGLHNYLQLVRDGIFWSSFGHNIIIIVLSIIGQMGIAFVLSVILQSKWTRLRGVHRTVIFLPVVLPAVVVGFIWNLIYDKNYGLLDLILKSLHLKSWIHPWLDNPHSVMLAVTIPVIWQFIGLYLIIFMSAIQNIPAEIYEVAEIDGAGGFKKAVYITLPMLYETVKVSLMLCIAGNMKIFDNIFVMTGGGPGYSSTVMAQYAYNKSFVDFHLGYGSAISIGMIILSLGLILLSRGLMRGRHT